MHMDVIELREFYESALGKAAENSISMALSSLWGDSKGEYLLGMGYPVPWLDRFRSDSEKVSCLMPATQGAFPWPTAEPPSTVLAHDDELPFSDSTFDRVLLAHCLEHAESANQCLSEVWRVLRPGGKLILIAPNRRGVWSRFENTPFGTGKPYSKGQLKNALMANDFSPEGWADALHFPPSSRDFSLRFRASVERIGRRFWPVFAGAVCVSASKHIYQGIPVTARAKRRVTVPVLVPQGSGRTLRN